MYTEYIYCVNLYSKNKVYLREVSYQNTFHLVLWYILAAHYFTYLRQPMRRPVPVFTKRGWCVVFETSALEYNLGRERDADDYIDYSAVDVSCRLQNRVGYLAMYNDIGKNISSCRALLLNLICVHVSPLLPGRPHTEHCSSQ